MPSKPKIVAILGPTASGKTKLAIQLAQDFGGEIISADSRQIYKGMNIGTGKDLTEYNSTNYHLIDIIEPDKDFNLSHYKPLAEKKIKQVLSNDHLPVLVGGSGLWARALIENYSLPSVKPESKFRGFLLGLSLADKVKKLKELDPQSAHSVDLKNERRVTRALEVCLTGEKISALKKQAEPKYKTLKLCIKIDRQKLKQKINQRVDKMFSEGLVEETQKVIKKYGQNLVVLNTIGYAEVVDYLHGKTSLEEAKELTKAHTHQFAKRQMTWFRKEKNLIWIKNYAEAKKEIKKFLNNI